MEQWLASFDWAGLLGKVVAVAAAVAVALVVQRGVVRLASRALSASNVPSASIFINILRAFIWSFALLAVWRPVFGTEPTAFVTSLGVASVTVSLGLQDTISNLIGGLGLMLGKVVRPGDNVAVGDVSGTVTDVTWRSTTVRSRGGSVEIIPNSVLNKTALTHVTDWSVGYCGVAFVAAPDADLTAVAKDALETAQRALAGALDPAFEPDVVFSALTPQGAQGEVRLHVTEGVEFSQAQDRLVRALQGRPWLARVPACEPAPSR